MKNSTLTIATILWLTTPFLPSCNSSTDKMEDKKEAVLEINEKLEVAQEEFLAEVENFKKETTEKIKANDKMIADFEVKMEKSKEEVKLIYKEKVEKLKKMNEELKKRLEEYKVDDKTKWEQFKVEFNSDMKRFGEAFKNLTVDNEK